jgi:hypothetical protein
VKSASDEPPLTPWQGPAVDDANVLFGKGLKKEFLEKKNFGIFGICFLKKVDGAQKTVSIRFA